MSNDNIHVSFILATYNRAQYLEKLLINVRDFIGDNDELIIMDGGSTDDTLEVISKHRDIITIFVSEKDNGPNHAYNKALLKSRGRLIMNIYDDDYFYPEGVRKAIEVMDQIPEIDVLTFGGEITEYNSVTGGKDIIGYQYLPEELVLSSDVKNFMNYVQGGFIIINRRIISLTGLFDASVLAADTQYFSQLLLCGANFKYFNCKVFNHTAYPHSLQNNVDASHCDRVRILMRHGEWSEIHKYRFIDLCRAMGLCLETHYYIKIVYMMVLCVAFYLTVIYTKINNIGIFVKMVLSHSEKNKEPNWDSSIR